MGHIITSPSRAQAFFLIERVSNIHSLFLTDKIIQIAKSAIDTKQIKIEDVAELIRLYEQSISTGKIKDPQGGLARMAAEVLSGQQGPRAGGQ